MRRVIVCGLLAVWAGTVFAALGAAVEPAAKGEPAAKENPHLGRLRHVVLFKFKDDTKAEDVQAIEKAFAALPEKIDTIVDFEWGTDVSVENLSQGFTHCFVVTFKDTEGRKTYLPHPAHEAFVKLLGPHLDKVLVIDFVVKN